MKISRLRLLGFKSFVEPTELVIPQGLTGVVGPNGCGKSNLLEALRWVMGESSHKSMRAAAMDHVIFSGTATRPPRNTAEVTIFIDNTNRNEQSFALKTFPQELQKAGYQTAFMGKCPRQCNAARYPRPARPDFWARGPWTFLFRHSLTSR